MAIAHPARTETLPGAPNRGWVRSGGSPVRPAAGLADGDALAQQAIPGLHPQDPEDRLVQPGHEPWILADQLEHGGPRIDPLLPVYGRGGEEEVVAGEEGAPDELARVAVGREEQA